MNYKFISINNLVDYIINHPGEEVGFTSDSETDIKVNGEPTGWYGVRYGRAFDAPFFLIGEYGYGPIRAIFGEDDLGYSEKDQKKNIVNCLIQFFSNEFSIPINDSSDEICVDADDMK